MLSFFACSVNSLCMAAIISKQLLAANGRASEWKRDRVAGRWQFLSPAKAGFRNNISLVQKLAPLSGCEPINRYRGCPLRFGLRPLSGNPSGVDALDEQPQRERDFEHEHRHPHKKGHSDNTNELHGKSYQEQHRGEYAQPGQRDGDAPGTQEEVAVERAAYDEANRADTAAPPALLQ